MMTKDAGQVSLRQLIPYGAVVATTLWAATAWGEEALPETEDETSDDAEAAAAPVELPPPEETLDDEAAPDEEAPTTAEEPAGGEDAQENAEEDETPRYFQFGHRMQGGIAFLLGTGYAFEIAYGGDRCYSEEDPDATVCNRRAPFFFDFIGSFGVTNSLEVLIEYRLGLLEETVVSDDGASVSDSRPMAFGFGVRYYISGLNRLKFNIGVILDIDFTKSLKTDVYIRPIFGLTVEIVRWVAFFIQASVNMSFIRAFGVMLEGGGGFQFRFP